MPYLKKFWSKVSNRRFDIEFDTVVLKISGYLYASALMSNLFLLVDI